MSSKLLGERTVPRSGFSLVRLLEVAAENIFGTVSEEKSAVRCAQLIFSFASAFPRP
jgi:hypothetical protein